MGNGGLDYEVWELAIQREIEAYHLYMALAQCVDNPQLKVVLMEFAQEELDHKAKLELEILKDGQTIPLGHRSPEIKHDEYIMSNIESLRDMDYKDVLQFAIQKEEASFSTYIDLIPAVYDQQTKEVLMAIAEEEVKHKIRFEIEYDLLTKQG